MSGPCPRTCPRSRRRKSVGRSELIGGGVKAAARQPLTGRPGWIPDPTSLVPKSCCENEREERWKHENLPGVDLVDPDSDRENADDPTRRGQLCERWRREYHGRSCCKPTGEAGCFSGRVRRLGTVAEHRSGGARAGREQASVPADGLPLPEKTPVAVSPCFGPSSRSASSEAGSRPPILPI